MSLHVRSLVRWVARRSSGRVGARPQLHIDRLEDRLAPTVTKTPYPGTAPPTISPTELLATVVSPNPLSDVANVVAYLHLSSVVDLSRTSVVFASPGNTLISVGLKPGANPVTVSNTLSSVSSVFGWASPNYVYSVGPSVLERIPNDPQYGGQWQLPKIDAPTAWDTTYGSPGVLVAVLDDGFDLTHPDLATNIAINPNEIAGDGIDNDGNGYVDDVYGWNFALNTNNVMPADPRVDVHGTEVAGLIAARVDNAMGVTGVAGRTKILPETVVSNGKMTSLGLARAAVYAVSRGAKIITNSTNIDPLVNDPVFCDAVEFAYDHGVLWINSAGNGNVADPPREAFEQMVLVAATDRTDHKTDYSNYGTGIDLSAPGGTATDGLLTTVPVQAGSYGLAYGTSMAAPIVAGTAALIWAAHPGYTRDQVVSRLSTTADDLNFLNPAYEDQLGAGRVNAGAAVGTAAATSRLGPLSGLPGPGQSTPYAITTFTLHLPNPLAVSSVAASSFDLREAGPDGQFDTADDRLIPFTINDGRPYYYGTNDLTFTAYGLQDQGLYRFTAKADSLRDPFGNPVDGDGDGSPGGDLVRYFGVGPQVNGIVFDDHDGDQTDDPSDPGVGGTEVYIDNNHNGQLDQSTFGTTSDGLPIPDNDANGVSSTITVSGVNDPVTRTEVTVSIQHPYPSDLTITLTSPSGKTITLLGNRYLAVSTTGEWTVTFDDAAGPTPDAQGHVRPDESLAAFLGSDSNGPWTLTVKDTAANDKGTLDGWSLSFATEPVAVTNPDGSFALPRSGPGVVPVSVVPPPGWAPVHQEIPAQDSQDVAIPLIRPGAIYGQVLLDNGDGTFGIGDSGFPGAVVYADRNGNGQFDPGEPSTTTDRFGNFTLIGLAPGGYTIRVSVPRAFAVLSPVNGGRPVTVFPGTTEFGTDFLLMTDTSADHPDAVPVTPDPRNAPVNAVEFDLARPIDGLTIADVTLTRDGVPVSLAGATLVGSGTHYALAGLDSVTATEGHYQVELSVDGPPGGNSGQSTSPPAVGTWTVDTTAPTAAFDSTASNVVHLSEPLTGLTLADFTLTRNGVAVLLTGVTLTPTADGVRLDNLAAATTNAGNYVLTLNSSSGLTDAAGNPLAAPASTAFTIKPKFTDHYAVAADAGGTPLLSAYDPLSGAVVWKVFAYESTFTGGVRVTTADVNGDGVVDVIVAPGPGRPAEIRAFNGIDGTELFSFQAFEPTFTGGAFVAAGDFNGDGKAEIVVTPDQGGGPRVRVLADAGQTVLADFFGIDDPNFRGGARATVGDLNHDGTPDLIVAAGYGGGPRIAGYNGAALRTGQEVKLFADFFAFEPTLRNGAYVALGDFTGDGFADLVTAGGPGGGPRVQVLDGQTLINTGQRTAIANFYAGDPNGRNGARVAVKDLDGDGVSDLLTADGGSVVHGYLSTNFLSNPAPTADRSFDAFPTFVGGVFVG
jgi:subtilisin family serine protease/subtilisin-like proprotein convertase family protein